MQTLAELAKGAMLGQAEVATPQPVLVPSLSMGGLWARLPYKHCRGFKSSRLQLAQSLAWHAPRLYLI